MGPRWIVHYKNRNKVYLELIGLLNIKGIPYRSEGNSSEEIEVVTGAGRFSGRQLVEMLKD